MKPNKECMTYALDTSAGIKTLLRERHRIASRRYYAGDTVASDIIADLNSSIDKASLSPRQTEAVALVYGLDVTQEMAASIIGVPQSSVAQYIREATVKIAAVYRKWEYGQITVEYMKRDGSHEYEHDE